MKKNEIIVLCELRKKFGFAETFTFSREGAWKKGACLLLNFVLNKNQKTKNPNKEKTGEFQLNHHLIKFNLQEISEFNPY